MCFLLSLKLFCFGITLTSQWKLPGQLTDIHFHKGHCDIVAVIDSVFFSSKPKDIVKAKISRFVCSCRTQHHCEQCMYATVDSF